MFFAMSLRAQAGNFAFLNSINGHTDGGAQNGEKMTE